MGIKDFYNKVAPVYEELISSHEVDAKLLPNLKKVFDKYSITNGSILDLGCGPGNLKSTLGNSFSYTGIDISEQMLQQAQLRGYRIIYGFLEQELLKIPDKSFDYVVSLGMLHFIKDIDFIFSEINRIARKGWCISLADVTENYKNYFYSMEQALVYNHTKSFIANLDEDITFDAWTSPGSKERIKERLVFKKII